MAVIARVTEKLFYVIVFLDIFFFSKTLTLELSSNGKSYFGGPRAVKATAFQITLLLMHRMGILSQIRMAGSHFLLSSIR